MRFSLTALAILVSFCSVQAFAPYSTTVSGSALQSTVEEHQAQADATTSSVHVPSKVIQDSDLVALTADEINSRLAAQLDKLRAVDQTSSKLSKGVRECCCSHIFLEGDV